MDMREKTILITGAAGTVGSAISLRLAELGANLVLLDSAVEAAQALAASLDADTLVVEANVISESDIAHAVTAAIERFGRIDGLVNNAGVEGPSASLPDYRLIDFERVMAVNVTGVFLGMKHVLPVLAAAGGGAIVNVGSTSGLLGNPNAAAYVASKHAVIGLTRAAAVEWGRSGIRVCCVASGPLESPMMTSFEANQPVADGSVRAWYERQTPLGRYGRSEEVADLVVFLLSDRAKFLSGGVYVCDGGLTAGGRPNG